MIIKYKKSDNLLCTELDGEICLFHTVTANYLNLNITASFIWNNIKKSFTVNSIKDLLLEEFDVDQETCQKEIKEFIIKCIKLEMIEEV